MSERSWRIGAVASAVGVVILLFIGFLAGVSFNTTAAGSNPGSSASPPSSGSGTTPAAKPTPDQATLTRLTVDYHNPGFDCARAVKASGRKQVMGVYVYDVGVLKTVDHGHAGKRQWSDAISTRLPGATAAAKRHALQVAICLDPYVGSVWAHALGTLHVGGSKVSAMNQWLRPFADASQVNDQARHFGALLDPKAMSQKEKAATKFVTVNKAWQKRANAIDELLAQFDPTAVRSLPSARNWHAIPLSGTLPEVGLNHRQESLPALVLNVTQKGACAPLLSIGANVGDMRPEVFQTPSCRAPQVVVTRCVSNCTPPTGGCHAASCRPVEVCVSNCGVPGHKCPCISKAQASQSPLPPPVGPSGAPSTAPSAQPTKPVDTANPPSPTPSGFNGGPSQPGTTAPPPTMSDAPSAPNTGDGGGF